MLFFIHNQAQLVRQRIGTKIWCMQVKPIYFVMHFRLVKQSAEKWKLRVWWFMKQSDENEIEKKSDLKAKKVEGEDNKAW